MSISEVYTVVLLEMKFRILCLDGYAGIVFQAAPFNSLMN